MPIACGCRPNRSTGCSALASKFTMWPERYNGRNSGEFLAESTGAYVEDLMDLQTVVAALNKPPYNYGVTAVTLRFVIYALDVLLDFYSRK